MTTPAHRHRRAELGGPAVIAFAREDDERPEVRRAAQAHARAHGCLVILYAMDVASAWSEPMPNQWASEGEVERFGDRLSPDDLDALGRSSMARQVRTGRRAGARGAAWLPKDKGVGALAEYAAAEGVHMVFVPESLDAIDELRELLAGPRSDGKPAATEIRLQVVGGPPPTAAGHTPDDPRT